jgi:hypothetical protein
VFVENEFVVAFGREVERGSNDADGCEDQNGPGRGGEVEGCVQVPAVPEAGVVVVEVGLVNCQVLRTRGR